MSDDGIVGHQPDHVPTLADHDLGFIGQATSRLCAKPRLRHRSPDDERACRTDVDGVEVPQLLGDPARPDLRPPSYHGALIDIITHPVACGKAPLRVQTSHSFPDLESR